MMEQQEESAADSESGGNPESTTIKTGEKPKFVGLYREDVVQSALQPAVLGMVTKVAGDSDSDDSESDDDETDTISQGCARICWSNLEESTEKIDDIRVVDRAFLHGDIVAAVAAPLGQTGTVVNVDLRVDLELPSGEILRDVDSKKIKRIRTFVVGDYVILDHWLGRVDEVVDNVTVMFDDGSECKIFRADPERLVPIPESPMYDSDCPYYPGQRVRGSSSALFKSARWLKGSWKSNRMECTVADVEVGSVVVYWIAAAHPGYNAQSAAIPSEQQDPKRLKRMRDLSYTNWQLGDRALLPQRLAKKDPAARPVLLEAAPSECETENFENAEQTPISVCAEAGSSSAVDTKDSGQDSWVAYRRKLRRRFSKHKKKTHKKENFVERALLIVGTKTKVDVVWQDGTREQGVDACTLFPVDHLGDHDFWPEQHVMERSSDFEGSDSEIKRVGIVKSVDSHQRTAKVRWLRPVERPEEAHHFDSEEVVSVYELIEHPDYSYCLGDVVIRLCSTLDASSEVCCAPMLEGAEATVFSSVEHNFEGDCENVDKPAPTEVLAPEKKEKDKSAGKVKSADLSWVGVLIGLQDGEIEVAWADGEVSKVSPQAIFVVGRDEDDGSSQSTGVEDAEEAEDAGSWTTMDSSDMNEVETGEQELGALDWDESAAWEDKKEGCDTVDQMNGAGQGSSSERQCQTSGHGPLGECASYGLGSALSLPLTALIRALKFAAGLLWTLRGVKRNLGSQDRIVLKVGRERQLGEPGIVTEQSPESSQDQLVEQSTLGSPAMSGILDAVPDPIDEREYDCDEPLSPEDRSNVTCSSEDNIPKDAAELQEQLCLENTDRSIIGSEVAVQTPYMFKRFDSVKDSVDHHFTNETGQPSSQRRWSKKIQQEWAILEKNLPDTIYVRVYEDRMDLMRSVIVGAAGTPYHDGLFFFDLHLPPEYPNVPPLVHYHSGGLRLNPNLYETGKVCLSLLNTWTGKGNEIWHPSTSSILQVLVSVQGLVLNAKPYFNEAGYDRQIGTAEGEKNSLAYVENSFLLSCKSMLYVIRRPPKHFEEFVREHFKQRGPYILQACHAYMRGSPVGSLREDATVSPLHGCDMEQTSSTGFRLMIAKLMPRLTAALTDVGANCEQYEQLDAANC